ncbi:MAG: class I SAM-dependent methyltransferase [Actinobacteria bacterium]|nr:class I SAM-dependent methyltransferase [Actinomycetota bacterium]
MAPALPPTPRRSLECVPSSLPLTGERTVPGIAREQYWFARHEVVYRWLAPRCTGQRVVEAGSGEGYGARILHQAGGRVVAVDYDQAAIEHSAATYPLPHVRANLAALPFSAVDAVVSLQVIEHLWDLRHFLAEVRRIATWTCLSTPNRLTFSPGLRRGEKPTNPFHVEEFDADQLHGLVREAGFRDIAMFGVRHGPRLAARPGIITEQIEAALSGTWPGELEAFVAGVRTDDFLITDADLDTSLDLVVVAS